MKKYITTVSLAKISVWFFVAILSIATASAQTDLPDAPVDEAPAAPIDDYVWVMAAMGFIYVFIRLRAFATHKST